MSNKYPEGSEWRKWDLHIHTPKSIIQDFGGDNDTAWDNFIVKIASLPPEIKVIGVTDYLFIDGYEKILQRRAEIPNIELIIPNIEFRLNTFSGTAHHTKRHNFHVLFDPTVSIQDIRDQLLNCLSNAYKITDNAVWNKTPTLRSLAELGKQIKASAPSDNSVQSKSDLEVGFGNITYKRDEIEGLLEKDCFKGKFVIAIGYSEWDQSRWDQSAAEKRTLINEANFCLTSLDDPAKIEQNRNDLEVNNLNSIVFHSSDAHELDRIGKTLLWLKADPTFAGLKQVMNEPVGRVYIGNTPPNLKHEHKIISKIKVANSNDWFEKDFELELNRDLISIIGGRGSGKSALAEAIAFGAGSKDPSEDAFLKKATKHKQSIEGTEIELEWADATQTKFTVGNLEEDHGLVRYLPQGVVEELCSHKNSAKLQKQIENVIFQALDDTERMGASNFDELRSQLLVDFQFEKDQSVKKIEELNKKIQVLTKLIGDLPEKEKKLETRKKELKKLNESLPTLPPEDKAGQEELAKLLDEKKLFDDKIIEVQSKLNTISEIETKIKIFKSQIESFENGLLPELQKLGITDNSVFKVNLNETGISTVLKEKKDTFSQTIKTLREGTKAETSTIINVEVDKLSFDNLTSLNGGIETKQKQTKAYESVKMKYQQQKKTIRDLETQIDSLEKEITKIKDNSTTERETLETERMACYVSFFEILGREKNAMEQIYKPLQDSLLQGTDTDKKLKFEAKIVYQIDQHARSGLDIIDRTRKGNFKELKNLETALSSFWDEVERNDFDKKVIETELNKICNQFTELDGKTIKIADQLRENYNLEDFFNWLFDASKFEIASSIKFDNNDLYVLSPGQKGIILLMLYLEIDKGDYRPLIIDQPEENLDNLSVYKDLIDYFRERKKYRQIIIVTHNPNLVVNTDSEQIIIAKYDGNISPRLSYCTGSLENQAEHIPDIPVDELEDGVIEQVCQILEGGEKAFGNRKKVYQSSIKSKF
ncbi:MAG: hypothetical protein IT280_12400 [Ignavibacteria bacterium]|nr:hypothetical protein [Ignavibacteria bacterium]